jgi:hypothetical protein
MDSKWRLKNRLTSPESKFNKKTTFNISQRLISEKKLKSFIIKFAT